MDPSKINEWHKVYLQAISELGIFWLFCLIVRVTNYPSFTINMKVLTKQFLFYLIKFDLNNLEMSLKQLWNAGYYSQYIFYKKICLNCA